MAARLFEAAKTRILKTERVLEFTLLGHWTANQRCQTLSKLAVPVVQAAQTRQTVERATRRLVPWPTALSFALAVFSLLFHPSRLSPLTSRHYLTNPPSSPTALVLEFFPFNTR
jgi:hypothetical protein